MRKSSCLIHLKKGRKNKRSGLRVNSRQQKKLKTWLLIWLAGRRLGSWPITAGPGLPALDGFDRTAAATQLSMQRKANSPLAAGAKYAISVNRASAQLNPDTHQETNDFGEREEVSISVGLDHGIMCEPCNGRGWLLCDFCEGQKTNVRSEASNRIYRRCPNCKGVGYVLCSKCPVLRAQRRSWPTTNPKAWTPSQAHPKPEAPSSEPRGGPGPLRIPRPGPQVKPTPSPRPRPPSPEEVLAHYESQGLDPKSASLKAISDLQSLLLLRSSSSRSASGAIVGAARGAWPHIVSVWESVKSATRSSD
ncbi:uncharacterized protein A4U43_C01F35420 [Asparagus officinalis]|uniref:Uncharacterized protein n=1 Tax=Asparagus officinalis TaxID=4686 RepID=A0A5P1FXT8_ASPOF|nr:uncharacterized protein A4U43_C01F35420 [Asparagus officinalis]